MENTVWFQTLYKDKDGNIFKTVGAAKHQPSNETFIIYTPLKNSNPMCVSEKVFKENFVKY